MMKNMARCFLHACFSLGLMACGSSEGVFGPDAGKDSGLAFPFDAGDEPDVVDTGPPCTEGDFHFELTNASGTTVLTGGCGDASAPSAVMDNACMDCESLVISACGPAGSIRGVAPVFPQSIPLGTFSTSEITLTYPSDAGGTCRWDSNVTVYDWPNPGGTVKGEYAAYHTGACAGDPSLVSGRFCLQRR
jgi:hypothetical protein